MQQVMIIPAAWPDALPRATLRTAAREFQ